MKKLILMLGMVGCGAALAFTLPVKSASAGDILGDVKRSVQDNWRKVSQQSERIGEMREELKTLPESSWFWTDQKDQKAKIRDQLREVRKLLLSTTAQKILEEVDEIDAELVKLNREIAEVSEERALNPEKEQSCQARIEKLKAKKTALNDQRRVKAGKVCAELRALGLDVSGEAAENCLFTVNFGELIDGVIVAKNIAAVVENLGKLMVTGDMAAVRRYYGMYLVMVDVQIICFEDYLEKSRHGSWRTGINEIYNNAHNARESALANARDDTFSAEHHQIFLRNAEINLSTCRAAQAYMQVLDAHESVIADKLAAAEKMRKVVASSYETINLAGDLIRLAKVNQEAFNSLLKLELPPIQSFNDAVVQQEFNEITRKLKE